MVQGAIRGERRGQVHLNEPRFQVRVQKNVESEHLKAVLAMHLVLLHGLDDIVLSASESLDDDVVDSRPQKIHIDTHRLQVLAESRETPFEAEVILLGVFVLHKCFVLFVDGVVGKVHVFIVFVEFCRVSFRSKPSQSFFVHIDAERLVASDHYVDSQVEFVPVDQQGVGDVTRNYTEIVHI